jgi:hypothetical protein
MTRSNSVIRWVKARLGRFTVKSRLFTWSTSTPLNFGRVLGALNWATGETVAVKEIQLSNIPKGELGQIMVRVDSCIAFYCTHSKSSSLQSEIDLLKNLNV